MTNAMNEASRPRCDWATHPLSVEYHDREWGVPVHDDRVWFEFLILEGAQAGLSWLTILKRREGYRRAFAGFDPVKVARFQRRRLDALMRNDGIIRNRLKIESAVSNARAFVGLQQKHGSFDEFIWDFMGGAPKVNRFKRLADVPAVTPDAERLSKVLKQQGFRFVGPTICYAFMQATGLVNDHLTGCFRFRELTG